MPVASVGVAVRPQGGEHGLRVAAVEEQLEAPPVEETGMARHEASSGIQSIHHSGVETEADVGTNRPTPRRQTVVEVVVSAAASRSTVSRQPSRMPSDHHSCTAASERPAGSST